MKLERSSHSWDAFGKMDYYVRTTGYKQRFWEGFEEWWQRKKQTRFTAHHHDGVAYKSSGDYRATRHARYVFYLLDELQTLYVKPTSFSRSQGSFAYEK